MTEDERSAAMPVDDLFSLLGSEPRMRILRVLWDEFEFQDYVREEQSTLPFSKLRDRAGLRDPGNFNYHLKALTGVTVAHGEDGYQLNPLGYNLMRMMERYASFEYHEISPTPLEHSCPFCGGALIGRYERELVHVRCANCHGLGDEGTINYVQIPASNAAEASLSRLLDVATLEMESRIRFSGAGLCPECYTPLERTLGVCTDHTTSADEACSSCELRFSANIVPGCPSCRWGGAGPLVEVALIDPAVRAAFDRHDLGPTTAGPWAYRLNALGAVHETVDEQEPVVATFRFRLDGTEVAVTIDGTEIQGASE